jgi:hypothetical protein
MDQVAEIVGQAGEDANFSSHGNSVGSRRDALAHTCGKLMGMNMGDA